MRYDDDEFTFDVNPSLEDFESVSDLWEAAVRRPRQNIRAFVDRFVAVAKPQRNGQPMTTAEFAKISVNTILAFGRDWYVEVRAVPLPLPQPSGAGES